MAHIVGLFDAAINGVVLFVYGSRPAASGVGSLARLPLVGDVAAIRAGAGSLLRFAQVGHGVLSDRVGGRPTSSLRASPAA
ncbi:MAG TPA: hypothetical protein VFJ58_25790 [Armatimonadota bacterium]|nr:hypothetical protein [Armatimonadota bacterium]